MAAITKFIILGLFSFLFMANICSAGRRFDGKGEMFGDWCNGFPEDNCFLSRPNYQLKQVPCVWCYAREMCMETLDRCVR
uniref:Uncharacterized protein n=1 Tax=Plectus sambesii TaxID=2011161 RepID=A0A914WA30_9BILA